MEKWIAERYPDRAKLLHDWAEPSLGIGRDLQATADGEGARSGGAGSAGAAEGRGVSEPDAVRSGFNPLKVYDYSLFTQNVFAGWVKQMRAMIRGTGSTAADHRGAG